jgi:hypothetical protein
LQTAQAVHAAFSFSLTHPFMTEAWYRESNFVVVLAVPDEPSLKHHFTRMPDSVPKCIVLEPDLNDAVTAFAALGAEAGQKLANLPLAGKELVMT